MKIHDFHKKENNKLLPILIEKEVSGTLRRVRATSVRDAAMGLLQITMKEAGYGFTREDEAKYVMEVVDSQGDGMFTYATALPLMGVYVMSLHTVTREGGKFTLNSKMRKHFAYSISKELETALDEYKKTLQ